MRRGRHRAGSDSSVHSVNVAEVVSHRVSTAGEVSSGPTLHPELESESDIFAYNASEADNARTVDSGYGYDAAKEHEDTEEFQARGLGGTWWNSEQHRPWSSGSVFSPEHKGTHKSSSGNKRSTDDPSNEAFRTTKEVSCFLTNYNRL